MNETTTAPRALSIIGAGHLGSSIHATSKRRNGSSPEVRLLDREYGNQRLAGVTLLLCVPDGQIEVVAQELIESGNLPDFIGHVSGATSLDPLEDASLKGSFSIHPLQTVPEHDADLGGCPAAVAGSNPAALEMATSLAGDLGLSTFRIEESDRALYHAAASMASNFLITLEDSAAAILEAIHVESSRAILAPLVRQSIENWVRDGAAAMTGPIARDDEATVSAHRTAISTEHPDLLDLYDALAERTRQIVISQGGTFR